MLEGMILEWLREVRSREWTPVSAAAAGATLLAFGLLWLLLATDDDGYLRVLDDANLVFHEAGHPIFGILGPTMGLYGGTLGQLAFPVAGALTFWIRRATLSFAVCVVWLGENLVNVARYVADARAQELPLAGGGEHDWTDILGRWGALASDTRIAARIRLAGWVVMLAAGAWVAWRAWRDQRMDQGTGGSS
jgi:hypothetical protein